MHAAYSRASSTEEGLYAVEGTQIIFRIYWNIVSGMLVF